MGVTVLFQQPAAAAAAAGSEDDKAETSLPDEVKDLFADASTGALVIAFVSPAAAQKLLATSDMTAVSDMRSVLVTNPHFADLVSKLGQVVSRYSGMRGVVDVQGSALHELVSPEEPEDSAGANVPVTFTLFNLIESRVFDMVDPRPNPECKVSPG